jgi:Domain of unknown function (DUF3331)
MVEKANFTDPWMQTIDLLSVLSGGTVAGVNELAAAVAWKGRKEYHLPTMGKRYDVQVQLVDRPTRSTATIAWRDSTACSYGDQVWYASRARMKGVCVISGRAILPGDLVYRPRMYRPRPINAGAMVLGSVLNAASANL